MSFASVTPAIRLLMAVVACCLASFAFGGEENKGAHQEPVPAEVRDALDSALKAIQVQDFACGDQPYNAAMSCAIQCAGKFAISLDKLGHTLDEQTVNGLRNAALEPLERELLAMAICKVKHPELFREIETSYVKIKENRTQQVLVSPLVKSRHAKEEFRPVWEYYVLSPMPEGAVDVYRKRALDALGKIGSKASLPVLVHFYKLTVLTGVRPLDAARLQRDTLTAMAHFSSEEGLRSILECLSLSKAQQTNLVPADAEKWRPEAYVHESLTNDDAGPERAKTWHKVIEGFPKKDLLPWQTDLLQRILEGKPETAADKE